MVIGKGRRSKISWPVLRLYKRFAWQDWRKSQIPGRTFCNSEWKC